MNKVFVTMFFVLLVAVMSGCANLQSAWSNFAARDSAVTLAVNDIRTAGQAGSASLEGTASLPDGTQLAVSAVRTLEDVPSRDAFSDDAPYAILDRKFATVEDGQWQANLTLWQPDANDAPFESWQLNPELLQEALTPSSTVVFIVTLEPISFSPAIDTIVRDAIINDGNTQLSYTSGGEAYLQIRESLAIPIPSGTVATGNDSTLSRYGDIWQGRSDYSPKIDELSDRAQLPFADTDNLPLPASNMMQ